MTNASVANLTATWSSLDALLDVLTDDEWSRETGCPGWTVQDNVAHLIDYEAKALASQPLSGAVEGHRPAHVKNDLGASNEPGVAARRALAPSDVLAELRAVTAARLAQLHELTDEDLAREVDLPVGRGTVADMLTLRVMDTWSHEQDIRRAVGRPGHAVGPAVDESVDYFCRFLPIIVVKRADPPEDCVVAFELDGRPPFAVVVTGGRGRVEPLTDHEPTVALALSAPTFGALVCGRSDVSADDVAVTGDAGLAARVIGALGFMP